MLWACNSQAFDDFDDAVRGNTDLHTVGMYGTDLAVHAPGDPCASRGPQARPPQGYEAGHRVQVVKGKRPTVDLLLRGASAAAAPESEAAAPGALLCGLVTDVSGAL